MEPDIVFVRRDRLGILSDRGVEAAPDLVVEILSASTADHFGVPEYWIVDPEARAIEVWRAGGAVAAPEVFGPDDRIRWRPGPEGPVLESS